MRFVLTAASFVAIWVTVNACDIALRASGNPPANLSPHYQHQYVNVAWIGFIAFALITIGVIALTFRSYKKYNNRSY